MMKTSKNLVKLSILSLFTLSACGGGGGNGSFIQGKLNEGAPLAKQGSIEIKQGYLELVKNINPNVAKQLGNPAGKKRLVDQLLEQELLYQEALKRGIPKIEKYQEKAALYERVIFAQGLLEDELNKKAKEYYDKNKDAEFSQVQASHILFSTKAPSTKGKPDTAKLEAEALAKAQAAKKKLDGGAKWEEVVSEYSDDKLTQKRGGDLGKLSKNDRRAERLEWKDLLDKAFSLKPGQVSDPIKTKDGYHIIKVTEAPKVAPFDEVQSRIEFKLRAQVKNDLVKSLTKGAEVEYEDEGLKAFSQPRPKTPLPQQAPQGKPAPKAPKP